MGDGGINNPWQANVTLNSVADQNYVSYVCRLGMKLFNIPPTSFIRKKKKAITIQFSSTSLVEFLVSRGLPRGNKLDAGLYIPEWIMKNGEYRKACIRGLIDTDGCLYIHVHRVNGKEYRNIGFCFCSYSPPLIAQIAAIFEEFGIMPHISGQGRYIYLYKKDAVIRYMQVFGTSNDRIGSVYKKIGGVG